MKVKNYISSFFDFLKKMPYYRGDSNSVNRMNHRHKFLIEDFVSEIEGARVLDLASHDGRWCYAISAAGAKSVVGIEARKDLVDMFSKYPDDNLKSKIELRIADLFEGLERIIKNDEKFDVICVFGILYHLMDHHRLFLLLKKINPKLIIVDSEFAVRPGPVINLVMEDTSKYLNAAPYFEGQTKAIKGIPSFSALEKIMHTLNYKVKWSDWNILNEDNRNGVGDYYRKEAWRRATCSLRPM